MANPTPQEQDQVIARFLEHCHQKAYTAKQLIIKEGEPSNDLFYIVSGSVTVMIEDHKGHEIVLAYLNAGEFFGEMGFVVVAVLVMAMVESFFFLPAHLAHSKGLRSDHKPSFIEHKFDQGLSFLRDKIYLPVYQRMSIGNRWLSALTLTIFIGIFTVVIGMMGSGAVGFTFFPNLDENLLHNVLCKPNVPRLIVQEASQAFEVHIVCLF